MSNRQRHYLALLPSPFGEGGQRRAARRLSAAVLALALLAGCAPALPSEPTPTGAAPATLAPAETGPSGADPSARPDNDLADCERLGYPCSLAETPFELIERTDELLTMAREQLDQGSMDDALAMLMAQPDIVEAHASHHALVFRVDGAPEAWLIDRTGLTGSRPEGGRPEGRRSRPASDGAVLASVGSQPVGDGRRLMDTVVGIDTTGDGKIDNRDAKRALVLAPYFWDFQPWDESDLLAEMLGQLPGYAGNVKFFHNRREGDQNVKPEHYLSFDRYDTISVATHGARVCWDEPDGSHPCRVEVSTGITIQLADVMATGVVRGFVLADEYDDDASASTGLRYLVITPDFFRMNYPDGLNDTLLILSACETGNAEGNELAVAATGNNFVMMAWSEVVPSDAAFKASGLFTEQLSLGLSSRQAYQAVVDAGLHRATNSYGIVTRWQYISPGHNDVRIFELPALYVGGVQLVDGANITGAIVPTGDDSPDRLRLQFHVAGVHDVGRYPIRYVIDGKPTRGVYDLSSATPGDVPYSYDAEHEIDVGFDLPDGPFTIEAIVDLPEGGESRYSALVENMLLQGTWRGTGCVQGDDCGWEVRLHIVTLTGTNEPVRADIIFEHNEIVTFVDNGARGTVEGDKLTLVYSSGGIVRRYEATISGTTLSGTITTSYGNLPPPPGDKGPGFFDVSRDE